MAIKITLKNSVVQDSVPTTSHLAAVGELALNANINSLGIYMRASDNSIVKMAGPGSVTTPAASTTVAGIAELATSGETTTGTDTARVTTPAGVKAVTDAERTTSNNTYLAKAGGTLTGVLAATAGSNSAPAIHFGDTDSGIYGGTNTVSLAAGGTQGLTLNASARVNIPTRLGVGVADPTHLIHLADDGGCGIAIEDTGHGFASTKIVIENGGRDLKITPPQDLLFANGNGEAARITDSGRLLLGITSASAIAGNSLSKVQMSAADKSASIGISRFSANTSPPILNFGKARGASVGTMTIVQDNDDLGEINFCGADGADLGNVSSRIRGAVDGTPATDDIPGRIEFWTFKASNNTLTKALDILNNGQVRVPDDGIFAAGSGSDLKIYHDGSNSKISEEGTGQLHIQTNGENIQLNKDATENMLVARTDGSVDLYYDNAKKLETQTIGITVTGQVACDELNMADSTGSGNNRIKIGTGDDLEIYHNGNDSFIKDSGTGNLKLVSSRLDVTNSSNSEFCAKFIEDGAVDLYYDGSPKLETTSWGTQITGALKTSGGGISILTDSQKLILGAGDDLQIYHDGNNNHINTTSGYLLIQVDNNNLYLDANQIRLRGEDGGENLAKFIDDGGCELYYDNVLKLNTESAGTRIQGQLILPNTSGVSLSIKDGGQGCFGNGDDLKIYHNGTNSFIDNATGELNLRGNSLDFKTAAGAETYLTCTANGAVDLYHNNDRKFKTASNGVVVESSTGDAYLTVQAEQDASSADACLKAWTTNTSASCYLMFGDNDDTFVGGFKYQNSNNRLFVYTNNSINWHWDESGNFNSNSDSNKLQLGAGEDLEIYHNGSDSFIDDNGTGDLKIRTLNGNGIQLISSTSENMITCASDGAVKLYYDDVLKLETIANGIQTNGSHFVMDGNGANGNPKFACGNAADLNLFHNGTNSYIDNKKNHLFIRNNVDDDDGGNIYIQAKSGEYSINCNDDGAVQIYNNNSLKLNTDSSGIEVTGRIALSDNLDMPDNAKVILGTGDDLQLYHNGTINVIKTMNGTINIRYSGQEMILAEPSGEVALYYDNSKKLKTYNTGVLFYGDIRPDNTSNDRDCGVNGAKWDDVYATNGTIQTSDRNEKNTIVASDLGLDFINKLNPVSYKFNNKTRTHYGLIAQDIETVLNDIGKPSSGFAGFIKEDDSYGLRYNEFMSPLIKAVQELAAKVAALEGA